MKKFTKNLMLVAAAATALSAGAEATWEFNANSVNFLVGAQGSQGIMADFNNDGRLDIYYSGTGVNPIYDHPGLLNWQASSNMLYNNGDGTFTQDIISAEGTGEFEDVYDGDGNLTGQREKYRYVDPKHGIWPATYPHYATIDYNNDGLVDLLVAGKENNDWAAGFFNRIPEDFRASTSQGNFCMVLYKNNGDGSFSIEPNCNLPIVIPDRNNGGANFFNTIAWGDYDRDGYVDLAFCGIARDADPGEPNRVAQLWRNIDGTGRFEQMNIAETKGGSWTDAVTEGEGDEKVEVIPSRELEGWFLLISGNVTMADINNDGWLDLVFDGWVNKMSDGVYEAGSNGRVYLNVDNGEGGRKFIDVTDPTGQFYLTRAGNTQLVDLDGDGYLDLMNVGYGDHGLGWKTLYAHNNMGDDPENTKPEEIYNYCEPMGQYGLPDTECVKMIARDFDGDDIMDFLYVGAYDEKVFVGDAGGNYSQSVAMPIRGFDGSDGGEAVGDLTGNGLADRFQTGYTWVHNEAEMDGKNYREIIGCGDWSFGKWIWHNTTDVEIIAPDVPANVKTSIDETAKTITIEWDDVESPNCAYNVVVLTPSGKVIANIPVDPVTGALKVAENKNIAIRPFVNKYTLPYNEVGEYKMGVQALSLNNEKASAIAWGQNLVAGVGNITTDLTDNDVKVTVNGNSIVANATANADVKVIDMMGRTIATGVTNTPINVEANGVLIVNVVGKSVKVVK